MATRSTRPPVVALLLGVVAAATLLAGGRETWRFATTAARVRPATDEQLFAAGLLDLSGSPYAPFLRTVARRVRREGHVYLRIAGETCTQGSSLTSGDAFAIAYAILPAAATCDPALARFAIYFGAQPGPEADGAVPVVVADNTHVLLRRSG